MIVEDEPAAQRFLTAIIAQRCPGFEIACTAENGADAVRLLRETRVDIVITDIQMARMDGIALADWVSREQPEALTVIVSGHNDFEYAKGAIRARVVEYLLKPIVPADFAAVMEKLRGQIESRRRADKRAQLLRAARGAEAQGSPETWSGEACWLGAVRLGGSPNPANGGEEPFSGADGQEGLTAAEIREERSICFALEGLAEREQAEAATARLAGRAPFYTACLTRTALPEGLARLPALLAQAAEAEVLGISQTLPGREGSRPEASIGDSEQEKAALWRLRHAITGAMTHEIEGAINLLFAAWEANRRPLAQAEAHLRHIMRDLHDHAPPGQTLSLRELSLAVSAACGRAQSFSALREEIRLLCDALLRAPGPRNDGEQLAGRIQTYIRDHIGQPLTTQSVCSLFGISGSYLSQLFRKHVKMSFVEYVTRTRVEEAMRMLEQYPDMQLKDVARALGFSDQFYFSKVFRSVAGMPPSEYRK